MKKILIIENETRTRNLFLNSLKTDGYNVIGAENGLVGVQLAKEHLPDLVICDIQMPELDGYGVLKTLRQEPLTAVIPFIFLTAKIAKAELRQGMELGADDYLTKPCKVEELLRAIAIQLEKQTVIKQWYSTESQTIRESQSINTAIVPDPQSIFPDNFPQLNPVFQFIEENYDKQISLSDVAEAVGYSTAYLTNLVKRQTDKTVYNWIVERQMVEARMLLLKTDEPVNQIAAQVGYPDAGHFIRRFRQIYSISPKQWRNTHRK
ncbi:two-component system response regulator [Scytonema hofmannii PCC 7110]|uniref:Two-component system response regulator n=1 Tax=Scytonema hofmannii PCC 7110 TaxID=128403 RepID=A0A139X6R7_9CYAN|nr:response regulator [Scytonema hofmannii]KYC40376.1 two-component system response regulator [Scytonema hofmannii PCC 7110]